MAASDNLVSGVSGAEARGFAREQNTVPATSLWQGFVEGRFCFHASFWTEQSVGLAVRLTECRPRVRLGPNDDLVLTQKALLGAAQKEIALEHGVAPSTVTAAIARCLRSFGLGPRLRLAPALLVASVQAGDDPTVLQSLHCTSVEYPGRSGSFLYYEAPRPDRLLERVLTQAEYAVARLWLEGRSPSDIARLRGASSRTIANQLTCIRQKLGVAGRTNVLGYCFRTLGTSLDAA